MLLETLLKVAKKKKYCVEKATDCPPLLPKPLEKLLNEVKSHSTEVVDE